MHAYTENTKKGWHNTFFQELLESNEGNVISSEDKRIFCADIRLDW
jgi:hypothetical protein